MKSTVIGLYGYFVVVSVLLLGLLSEKVHSFTPLKPVVRFNGKSIVILNAETEKEGTDDAYFMTMTDEKKASELATTTKTVKTELVSNDNDNEGMTTSPAGIVVAVGIAAASVTFLVLQSLALSCIVLATILFVATKNGADDGDEESPFQKLVKGKDMDFALPEVEMLKESAKNDNSKDGEIMVSSLQAKIALLEQEKANLQDMVQVPSASTTTIEYEGEEGTAAAELQSRIAELEEVNEELERWKTEKILIEKASSEYTVKDLKAIAKDNGIDETGKKTELLGRLVKQDLI
mmetsp:Transcript_6106/g.8784  ORF Transcript_6106/g.8784 Transcript_6106/m.8784 type:complete len:292 (-) Transcript_6106:655-1530(-)